MLVDDLKSNVSTDVRGEIENRWKIWREEKMNRRADDRGQGVNSASIFHELSSAVDDDAIISVDVGNNTYSFGKVLRVQTAIRFDVGLPGFNRIFISRSNGGLGSNTRNRYSVF